MKTTVLIVDDHAMVRKGLRALIDAQPDLLVVSEAGTVQAGIELAQKVAPQVITLDLTMPDSSGVTSVRRMREAVPNARILVLTMHDDPVYIRSAIDLGASGYVNKAAADTELISAIRAVAQGRTFIDAAAAKGSPLHPHDPASPDSHDALSAREREVLQMVARGHTNQQVADSLGLSVKTVESYRARVMKKLGAKERAELVQYAMKAGMM
ncbi:MAG: response regulator transcription factor [Phycisphaerales bacterium]